MDQSRNSHFQFLLGSFLIGSTFVGCTSKMIAEDLGSEANIPIIESESESQEGSKEEPVIPQTPETTVPTTTTPIIPGYTYYYIDSTGGNDTNTGLSPEQAWKSLNQINTWQTNHLNSPGVGFLLKRGEIWREKLYLLASGSVDKPIIFGDYGDIEKENPLIRGSNCYGTACSNNTDGSWTQYNATQVYLLSRAEWSTQTVGVVSQNGKPLNFREWKPANPNGVLSTLIEGEYTFDYNSNTIYAWPKGGASPDNYKMEIAEEIYPIEGPGGVNAAANIQLEHLTVTHAGATCVKATDITNFSVKNMIIHTCGGGWKPSVSFYWGNGITIAGSSVGTVLKGNLIYDIFDSGISPQLYLYPNLHLQDMLIEDNTIYNFGLQGVEITVWRDLCMMSNVRVLSNTIYNGAKGWSGTENTNAGVGTGIYATTVSGSTISDVVIQGNKVYNNALDGIATGYFVGPTTITQNEVYNNEAYGVLVWDNHNPSTSTATISENQIYDNVGAGIYVDVPYGPASTAQNNILTNNQDTITISIHLGNYIP